MIVGLPINALSVGLWAHTKELNREKFSRTAKKALSAIIVCYSYDVKLRKYSPEVKTVLKDYITN